MDDPFGQAIFDYSLKGRASHLIVNSNYTEDEKIDVAYLFRTEDQMPELETLALKKCKGKIV